MSRFRPLSLNQLTGHVALVLLSACHPEQSLCDNKDPNWTYRPVQAEPVVDVVLVTRAGGLLWNATSIDRKELATRLDLKARSDVRPTTLLRHEQGTDCSKVAAARRLIASALGCTSGGCAEGGEWDSIPDNGFNGFDGGG